MKNIFLIIIICLFVISCGKKGDPEYKASNEIRNQKLIV
mgnify:CR=1 FL=1